MLKSSNFHAPKRSFQTLLKGAVKSCVFTILRPGPDFCRKICVRLQIQVPKSNFELVKTPLADSSPHWYGGNYIFCGLTLMGGNGKDTLPSIWLSSKTWLRAERDLSCQKGTSGHPAMLQNCFTTYHQYVPHKAVAEVSKIGNL